MSLEAVFISSAEAQSQTPANGKSQPGGLAGLFLPMILVFVIFYLLMIRPQAKQQKKHKELLGNLKRGDDIVTSAGIHGKIQGIADNLVTLEVADNVRIKMEKTQIAQVKTAAPS